MINENIFSKFEYNINHYMIFYILGGFSYILNDLGLAKVDNILFAINIVIIFSFIYSNILNNKYKGIILSNVLEKLKYLIAFMILCTISITWSKYPNETIKAVIKTLTYFIYSVYLCLSYDRDEIFYILARVLSVGAILSLILCIIMPSLGIKNDGLWNGIYGNKNILGLNMILGILCTVFYAKNHKFITKQKVIIYITVFVFIINLIKSVSMTAISVLMIALIIDFIIDKMKFKSLLIPTIIIFLCAMSIVFFREQLSFVLSNIFGKDPTFTGRTYIWEIVTNNFMDRPLLGYGYGSAWDLSKLYETGHYTQYISHAHNGLLEILVQLGLIGAVLFSVIIIQNILIIDRCRVTDKIYSRFIYSLGMMFLIYSIFESPTLNKIPILIVILVANTLNIKKGKQDEYINNKKSSR